MKKTIKIVSSLLFLLLAFVYFNFFSSIVFPWQKKDALETTLTWGGLAALPKVVGNVNVEKEGSAFTRSFKVEFDASQKEIDNWILNSKRLKNNIPKESGRNKTYQIYPGENKSFGGEVNIEKGKVTIRMSWS